MTHEGISMKVGGWLETKSKDFRFIVVIITLAITIFIHGFWIRQYLVYDLFTMNGFGFLYVEIIFSAFFGGPICWFLIALISYLMD